MRTGDRTRHFFQGVGSLIDWTPVADRYAASRRRIARALPDTTGYHFAPPGHVDGGINSVVSVVVLLEYLVRHPEMLATYPEDVYNIEAALAAAEQTPPVVEHHSPIGHLWVDAVRLAEDRYRVRLLIAARGRQCLQQIRAACHAPS